MLKILKQIYHQYSKQTPLLRFVMNCLILFVSWYIFYLFIRYTDLVNTIYETATQYITDFLVNASGILLNLLGFDTVVQGRMIRVEGTEGILLDRGCIGRNLLGLYAGFIIAYPGIVKSKIWFIPLGLVLINIINIIRISALALTLKYAPEYFNINHHAIFQYTVLVLTFIMWFIWIKKYARKNMKRQPKSDVV